MKRYLLSLATLLVLALVLPGCKEVYQFNQKITVVVETPQGEKTGSAVTAVSWIVYSELYTQFSLSKTATGSSLSGEAAFVDLGNGKYLFVLLKGVKHLALTAFFAPKNQGFDHAGPAVLSTRFKGPVDMSDEDAPMLVTFTDINDPKTVKKVDPYDLDAAFGCPKASKCYTLKSITLEITDEPVTKGRVEKILPCLNFLEICIPLNRALPYGHPMRNIPNSVFRSVTR
jgi:hypothetical protein